MDSAALGTERVNKGTRWVLVSKSDPTFLSTESARSCLTISRQKKVR